MIKGVVNPDLALSVKSAPTNLHSCILYEGVIINPMTDSEKQPLTLQKIIDSLDKLKIDELRRLQKATNERIQRRVDAWGKPLLSDLVAGLEWTEEYKDNPPISDARLQEIKDGARPTDTELEYIAEALEMDTEELLQMLRFRQI
ncbi:MAG: hypothetical protein RLP02_19600 [Coleofasciculus sp. C2-GNP5-27]